MPQPTIKLYGERNTGTNYLTRLLGINLDAHQLPGGTPLWLKRLQRTMPGQEWLRDTYFALTYLRNLGWKHACAPTYSDLDTYRRAHGPVGFVTLTKNPYSWLWSLYHRPYHHAPVTGQSFEDFLSTPWPLVARDRCSANTLETPIQLWNIKNRSYIGLRSYARTVPLTYENLLRDPAPLIEAIAESCGAIRKSTSFTNYRISTKDPDRNWIIYSNYYLKEEWKKEISKKSIDIINKNIDHDIMNFFGYSVI